MLRECREEASSSSCQFRFHDHLCFIGLFSAVTDLLKDIFYFHIKTLKLPVTFSPLNSRILIVKIY